MDLFFVIFGRNEQITLNGPPTSNFGTILRDRKVNVFCSVTNVVECSWNV